MCTFIFSALYLLYAKLEEEHGLARHAMSVYERATSAVLPEERFEVILLLHIFNNFYMQIYIIIRFFSFLFSSL